MERFADQDMGSWAGKTLAAISGQLPENMAIWLSDPAAVPHDGEASTRLSARMAGLMGALPGERGHTIAMTHPAVIATAVLHVPGVRLESSWRIDCGPMSVTGSPTDGRRWAAPAAS